MTIENAALLQVDVISWLMEYSSVWTSVASIAVTAAAVMIAYFTLKFQKESYDAATSAEKRGLI